MKTQAGMAELADATDSKSVDLRVMGVRPPLPAPNLSLCFYEQRSLAYLFKLRQTKNVTKLIDVPAPSK
jgi:hypothetical protein